MWALSACAIAVCALATDVGRARADDACAIEATLGDGTEIRVRRERGMRRVRLTAPRRVAITPLRSGIAAVRTIDGEGAEIAGTTRAPLRYVIARPISLREGAVELPQGMPIERLAVAPRGPWVEVDVALGDGLFLRRAPLPCSALTVAPDDAPIVAREAPALRGPLWRARTERVYVHGEPDAEGALRIDSSPSAAARLVEVGRRPGWIGVALRTARGARVRGWIRDTELVR